MIRVVASYRWSDGAHFDHEYYTSQHLRLTKEALAPHGLLRLESDRCISNKPPVAGDVIAATNAVFPSMETARAAMEAAGTTLMADVPTYTNIKPEIRLASVTTHL